MCIPGLVRNLSESYRNTAEAIKKPQAKAENFLQPLSPSDVVKDTASEDTIASKDSGSTSSSESLQFENTYALLERRINIDRPTSEIDTLAEKPGMYQLDGAEETPGSFTLFITVRRSFRFDHEERTTATLRRSKTSSSCIGASDGVFATQSIKAGYHAVSDNMSGPWERLEYFEDQEAESLPHRLCPELSDVMKKIDGMSFASFEDEQDIREINKQMLSQELRGMEDISWETQ